MQIILKNYKEYKNMNYKENSDKVEMEFLQNAT